MRHRMASIFRPNTNAVSINEKESRVSKDALACALPLSIQHISFFHCTTSPTSDEKCVKSQDSHKWTHPLGSHHKTNPAISYLDVEIESPPLVFYGPITTSSGALLSGQLVLRTLHESIVIESFEMRFELAITRRRPFHTHCTECGKQRTNLDRWKFLHGPTILSKGQHKFPFSGILPGHLPATTKGSLFQIEYKLHASLTLRGAAEPIKLSKVLDIKRAIIASETPRNSIRIFPPTNLTAHCELPSVIYPTGKSMVSLRIDGCAKKSGNSQYYWKLKRLHWHLEEIQKSVSPGCRKHLTKRTSKDEQSKSVAHTDARVIGEGYFRSGWKTDYSTEDGRIEMEFPIAINPSDRPSCDMKTEDGTEISHSLVIEMIVIEGVSQTQKPSEDIPTGVARFLRMHFDMTVTERSGLGISWDEEQPPLYENIPTSPPEYAHIFSCKGDPLPDYDSILRIDAVRVSSQPLSSVESPQAHSHIQFFSPELLRKFV
ncbi:hypothetical protein K3495_g8508 [Podosphaera aphanis]|nr:hypothetical protein K3495_g8508 [Podosphaera aphanis]